jgi:hypothetical protein
MPTVTDLNTRPLRVVQNLETYSFTIELLDADETDRIPLPSQRVTVAQLETAGFRRPSRQARRA